MLRRFRRLLSGRRGEIEREIDEELRFHLDARIAANLAAGMGPDEARRDALRRFGSVDAVRAEGAAILGAAGRRRPWRVLDELRQDLGFGLRLLRGHPLTSAAAVVSLALGIGANTANFSIVYGVLYRSLPFEEPQGIVTLRATNERRGVEEAGLTFGDLRDFGAAESLQGLAGVLPERSLTLTGGDRPERVQGSSVTPNLFSVLGVAPSLGRDFRADDAAPIGFEPVVVLSDGLWRRRFGADPDIVGRPVHINDRELVVVGIMPPGFRFPETDDLWLPLRPEDPGERQRRFVWGIGRLAPQTTLEAARRELAEVAARLGVEYAETHDGWGVRLVRFRDDLLDPNTQRLLHLLLGAVAFVLLIACANVANLLLARAADRQRETALRVALGAGRVRIVRQLLTESLLLALAGAAAGVLIAIWWIDAMKRAIPEDMAYWMRVDVDGTVLLYTLAVAAGTGLLFGILPALHAARPDVHTDLKESGRGTGESRASARWRGGLVVAEVAMAVVLIVGAALMMRSFLALQRADAGFDEASLLSLRIVLAGDRYDPIEAKAAYFQQAAQRVAALPGAASAAATSSIPADDGGPTLAVLADGDDRAADEATLAMVFYSTTGLFDTIDVPLVAGRDFTTAEVLDPEAPVAIIGASLARRLWPGRDPIGRRLRLADDDRRSLTVVGVAPDLQYEEFGEEVEPSLLQLHRPYAAGGWRNMALLVRVRAPRPQAALASQVRYRPGGTDQGDPAALTPAVRDELARLDPTLAPYDVMTMSERRRFTTWPQRIFGKTFASFGALALVLALTGVYGVIAYSVSRRGHEIGVRMALGARPADVVRQVTGRALGLAGLGIILGLAGAFALARLLQGLVYGVGTADPLTFAGVPAVLAAATLAAAWLPARRAAHVDPTEVLR